LFVYFANQATTLEELRGQPPNKADEDVLF